MRTHDRQLSELAFEITQITHAPPGTDLESVLRKLRELRLESRGMTVEQAGSHLELAPPTVRKWAVRGLLRVVGDTSPLEVEVGSVVEVASALRRVRASFPARHWMDQVAAYLADRDLQSQDWFQEGLAEYRRGELVD